MMTASSKKRKTNKKGLAILSNGAVSMRDLDLASQVPTKIRDEEAAELFKAKLTLSKAFTFFTFLLHCKNLPIEKVRDKTARAILLYSAAPYCLSEETMATILDQIPTRGRTTLSDWQRTLSRSCSMYFQDWWVTI